jgi:hypothetical protein
MGERHGKESGKEEEESTATQRLEGRRQGENHGPFAWAYFAGLSEQQLGSTLKEERVGREEARDRYQKVRSRRSGETWMSALVHGTKHYLGPLGQA